MYLPPLAFQISTIIHLFKRNTWRLNFIDSVHLGLYDIEASGNILERIAHSNIQQSRNRTLFIPVEKGKHR